MSLAAAEQLELNSFAEKAALPPSQLVWDSPIQFRAENRFNSLGCEIPNLCRGDFGTERKNPTPNDEFPVLQDIICSCMAVKDVQTSFGRALQNRKILTSSGKTMILLRGPRDVGA